ncbi:BglII/BstYI family type II restriction endonuclease [Brevibacillus sp. FIR094]|uniref:BglII/BstYI family type II restriction endonuclease n=1 Tax=Brevibacillus sp. FIR094 TaxID=3134809 RepID=UPI003D1DD8A8
MPLISDRWVQNNYFIDSRRNGLVILQNKYSHLWKEVKFVLKGFRLYFDEIANAGGGKSQVTQRLENLFKHKGWEAVEFQELNTLRMGKNIGTSNEQIKDEFNINSQTHEIDLFKEKVAIEIEWNNKHQFYSRDLETFDYLYKTGIIDLGIIITKHTSLHAFFDTLGYYIATREKIAKKFASTHTHTDKLYKLLQANRCSCPIIVIGLTDSVYRVRRT